MNKTNQFATGECANRRLIKANEFTCERSRSDQLKLIFQGEETVVNVKHKSGQSMGSNTPVYLTINNRLEFMGDPAFQERMAVFNLDTLPFAQSESELKPAYPMALFDLFQMYKIQLQ